MDISNSTEQEESIILVRKPHEKNPLEVESIG
jgi:hypothetical protein